MATTEQPQKSVGSPQIRKEDPELITGRSRFVDDITVPGMLWAHVVRSPFAHARINGVDVSKALAMEGCVAAYSGADLAIRVGGAPGLRLAGHRRHQDERALAPRQGQGAPRGRRRRRGGGREPRPRQGRRRAGRGRLGAASGGDRPARGDGGWRPARARRLRHQRVERLGVREGRLARPLQVVQALLRRPRPREGQAPLPAEAPHPERHGAARRDRGAERGDGRVHDVHGEPDPPHRADHPGHHLRHRRGQAARRGPGRGRRLRIEARHVRRGVDLPGPGTEAEPPDQVDGGALGGLRGHDPRARPLHRHGDGRDAGRCAQGCPRQRLVRRRRLPPDRHARHPDALGLALRRPLRRRGLRLRVHQHLHPHHAHRRLPRGGAPRGHVRRRADDGPPGARAGDRSGGAAAQELHPDRPLPQLHHRERPDGRTRATTPSPTTR